MKIGVCAYSFSYVCGFEGGNLKPLDAFGLMDLAVEYGLQGVEFPPKGCLPDLQPQTLSKVREYADQRGLFIVADVSQVKEENFNQMISVAKALGSKTLRVILSGILGGDRRPMAGRWKQHLSECLECFKAARDIAESNQIAVAIENHSDATSEDLIWICSQLNSPFIGVNLDTGNPLAVSEEPVEYAAKIAKYLKNAHLKDYKLYPTDEGYRMARCALGAGVVNFPELFKIFEKLPDLTGTIELGALYARHVRILMDDYWSEFDPRSVNELLPLMRLWLKNVRPKAEEWQTPRERNESTDILAKYEMNEFHESVEYLTRLGVIRDAKTV
jgi:sugar phosphate isomerase/epimerase